MRQGGVVWKAAIFVDQMIAVCFGSEPGETLSSMSWRLEQEGDRNGHQWRVQIDDIFFFVFGQRDHCRRAYAAYLRRRSQNRD